MIGRDLKRGIKIIAGGAGEIAGKLAKETERIGLKIQVDNIEKEIKASYRDLGVVAFEMITNGEGDLHEHEEIKKIMQRIHEDSLKKAKLLASEQGEHEGEATIICGGPCGAVAPPMPPHPALAPAKPDARFGFAGGGGDASPFNEEET